MVLKPVEILFFSKISFQDFSNNLRKDDLNYTFDIAYSARKLKLIKCFFIEDFFIEDRKFHKYTYFNSLYNRRRNYLYSA